MQTTFSKSCESQPVSLHDTTALVTPSLCPLNHSKTFSLEHNRNQWFPTYVLRSVVSPPLRLSLSPAIPLCPLLTSLLLRLQFAVVLVPRLCLLCLAPLRPKCPVFRATLCLQVHTALFRAFDYSCFSSQLGWCVAHCFSFTELNLSWAV